MSPRRVIAPQRREEIARATIRCLAREGAARLTMRKIAREAGVAQGILHYYFADKRAMLVAALETVMADLDRRVLREARGSRDARVRLRALVHACLATAVTQRELWVVFVEFWGAMMHDARLRRVNADLYARIRRVLAGEVTRGVRTGAFRPVRADHAAALILAVVDGLSLQLTFDPARVSAAAVGRIADDALARYLAADAGRAR
jgi:AcrR family transcriptional regulator